MIAGDVGVMHWLPALALLMVTVKPDPPFEWSGAKGCPSEAAVRRELRALLPDIDSLALETSFSARVQATPHEFVLVLRSSDASEPPRQLSANDCAALASAVVLVIAIELDALGATARLEHVRPGSATSPAEPTTTPEPPELALGAIVAQPARVAPSPEPPIEPPTEVDPPTTVPPKRAPIQGFVRVHGGAGVTGLPRAGSLVGGAVGLGSTRARIELLGDFQPRQRIHYPESTEGAWLRLWAGSLRGCPLLYLGPLEVPLCAGLWLGALHGEGIGIRPSRRVTDLWMTLELHGAVVWSPTARVALRAGVGVTAALRRPSFLLRGRPLLFRAPPLGVRLAAAVELRFPARRRTETASSGD